MSRLGQKSSVSANKRCHQSVLREVMAFTRDCPMALHNAWFDRSSRLAEAAVAGCEPDAANRSSCTMLLARCVNPDTPNHTPTICGTLAAKHRPLAVPASTRAGRSSPPEAFRFRPGPVASGAANASRLRVEPACVPEVVARALEAVLVVASLEEDRGMLPHQAIQRGMFQGCGDRRGPGQHPAHSNDVTCALRPRYLAQLPFTPAAFGAALTPAKHLELQLHVPCSH
ncbi:MAG: hypothetical protein KGM91_23395 [Burkholderiales bacterium]|nr:hypothetical protein [Burkholderiales bacterium]